MADAGHVAWDMERFQFLEKQEDFDSIHPSLLRQSVLNNNYGLYEVTPASTRCAVSISPTSPSSGARPVGS
jgi:alkyl sulfatase BDS1-like metallo-beta-lactamase superfamily hydrolase